LRALKEKIATIGTKVTKPRYPAASLKRPEAAVTFGLTPVDPMRLRSGVAVFIRAGAGVEGTYGADTASGLIARLVDTAVSMPGTAGNFGAFDEVSYDGAGIAFIARSPFLPEESQPAQHSQGLQSAEYFLQLPRPTIILK
jgi:hypothetical protein